jgi:hypothetical protein
MSIYNVNKNYQSGVEPTINTRGAYGIAPAAGSSNILGGGMKIAGSGAWSSEMDKAKQLFDSEQYKNATPEQQAVYRGYLPTAGSSDTQSLLDIARYQMSPEYKNAERQAALEFYKAQGDQQMKYSLINRGLTGLSEGIKAALTRYPDPYLTAQLTAGIADAASRGAEASRGFTQLGAGNNPVKYFNV